MTGRAAAVILAEFAHDLRHEDIPTDVIDLARTCMVDAVACSAYGARFPWSRMIAEHAAADGASGRCRLPMVDHPPLRAQHVALMGGAFAHAFELDSLRKPGAGVHAGATVAIPAIAVAQEVGAEPEELLRAIVAGTEVMFRIGNATLHSAEARGFHAPGITGPFGAAVAAGVLRKLSVDEMTNALGIAGSMGGGLLAFARGSGGMVKRLHLGRAAQSGVVAVDLASRGLEGPDRVLEGNFGTLEAFCPKSDPAKLTADLGAEWEFSHLCLKRYACHVTCQAPIEFLRGAMAEHGFSGAEIASVELGVSQKVLSHHGNPIPKDIAGAQYSVPFAFSAAAFGDPDDPRTFETSPDRPEVKDLAAGIRLVPGDLGDEKWGAEVTLRLHSGRTIEGRRMHFRGTPESPFTAGDLSRKFSRLTGLDLPSTPEAEWVRPGATGPD